MGRTYAKLPAAELDYQIMEPGETLAVGETVWLISYRKPRGGKVNQANKKAFDDFLDKSAASNRESRRPSGGPTTAGCSDRTIRLIKPQTTIMLDMDSSVSELMTIWGSYFRSCERIRACRRRTRWSRSWLRDCQKMTAAWRSPKSAFRVPARSAGNSDSSKHIEREKRKSRRG